MTPSAQSSDMTATEPEEHTPESITHDHPVPADQMKRYSVDRDPHSEYDVASYVEGQAPDEEVQHVEQIKREIVLGDAPTTVSMDISVDSGISALRH